MERGSTELLEKPGAKGMKRWQAFWNEKGVIIEFGPEGKTPKSHQIPLADCNPSPEVEARRRSQKKRDDGYQPVTSGPDATPTPESAEPDTAPNRSAKASESVELEDQLEGNGEWF